MIFFTLRIGINVPMTSPFSKATVCSFMSNANRLKEIHLQMYNKNMEFQNF